MAATLELSQFCEILNNIESKSVKKNIIFIFSINCYYL